ncbi:MAG: hypothetical protein WDN66_01310 [Candidatus Saccharibacteria bacterium]
MKTSKELQIRDRELAAEIDKLTLDTAPQEDVDNTISNPAPTKYEKVKTYSDGGSRGNPGPSASGFIVMDENDKVLVDKGV